VTSAARWAWSPPNAAAARGSGIEVEDRYVVLCELEGDKISGMTLYATTAEALEAAGLRE
jgi:hypothetical protein